MSEDSNILTVDENGLVTGVKQGQCKITAYSTEYNNLKGYIYLQSGYSNKLNIYGENRTYILKPGETLQLYTTKYNEEQGIEEQYNDVTYSVMVYEDEEQAATIDENGLLTAIAQGSALVLAVDKNDFKMTDSFIEVQNEIPVNSLEIISSNFKTHIDTDKGQLQIKAVSMPGNRLYENVTYSVNDESIATIDAETGLLTAIRNGDVIVTATSKTDASLTASETIGISNQKFIRIISPYHEIKRLGGSIQLEVLDEYDETYTDVTYTSRDTSIATVNETGLVTGVGAGKCIIEAVSNTDSRLRNTFEVTVFNGTLKIEAIGDNNTIKVGQTAQIPVRLMISDNEIFDYSNVTYTVSNGTIARVDNFGSITGISEGKVDVTVVDRADPGLSAIAKVTVVKAE